jgi:two-component system, sensor histidine kinase and response regulator
MQTPVENVASNCENVAAGCPEVTRRGRMLVVGEALCTQESLDAVMDWMDMDVEAAENDRIAGILATISLVEDRPYNVVLVDVQTPDAGGLKTVKWLRRHGWLGPIIALGDDPHGKHRKLFLRTGCDEFIDKPLARDKLQAAYSRVPKQSTETFHSLVAAQKTEKTSSNSEESPKSNGRVLVVEDALCMQAIVRGFLQHMNFDVDMADNGQVACDMAMQSLADGKPYDVILMDIQLPKMNGKQAAKWLRENNWNGPIIAVSSHATPKDHASFLTAGCNDCLAKPLDKDTLCKAISQYVHC